MIQISGLNNIGEIYEASNGSLTWISRDANVSASEQRIGVIYRLIKRVRTIERSPSRQGRWCLTRKFRF